MAAAYFNLCTVIGYTSGTYKHRPAGAIGLYSVGDMDVDISIIRSFFLHMVA